MAEGTGAKAEKFGTFGGVFTPSLLTIIGVIMFLRFSTVVGNAGLYSALLVLAAAKTITVITGLSISSIATNMRVKGGGAYFLISRSLGVEFGGVIAIFFYLAQTAAVTLYVVGFTEAIVSAFPGMDNSFRTVATITNMLIFASVYKGAGWTIRIQYGILAVLGLSILSFFIGAGMGFSPEILSDNLQPRWALGQSFFTIFALFFPAVTGIMAGVNMSGDLKDPSRSLPRGTLSAIGVSALVYALTAFFLAASIPRGELLGEGFVMEKYALIPVLLYAGVICATLSSALGSMMGAPRILQAFSRDNIVPKMAWLGHGSGPSGEPRRAVVLTFVLSQLGILGGDLNTIAPVITMFFLLTYGTVNLACFYEARSKNPSFRPSFRMNHWSVSLLGTVGCLGVMFLINPLWATVAFILSGILFRFIKRADLTVEWGSVGSGLAFQRARESLLQLERNIYHPKNWRPSILALSGGPFNRLHLAEYASWFTSGSGIVSIAQIMPGRLEDLYEQHRMAEESLRGFIAEKDLTAFPVVIVEEDIFMAIKALVQCHGISGIRPNTVLLGWSEDQSRAEMYHEMLRTVKRMRRSLIVVACEQRQESVLIPEGAINIWWASDGSNPLMLLLAYLLGRNPGWNGRPIRVIRPVPLDADTEAVKAGMAEMLVRARIQCEVVVLPTDDPLKAVQRAMHPSAVLFAGFNPDSDHPSDMKVKTDIPGDVILVYSAGDASLNA